MPGCESFDYASCDIRQPACVHNLAAIAHCLRGSDTTLPMPELVYVSQAEAERELTSLFPSEPPANANYFEVALTLLGLTRPGALSAMAQAERYAREWAAFYSHGRQAILVIEHATPLDPLSENVVLIHEMVHALQDGEHDLEAFSQRYRLGVDTDLRSSSVVEGAHYRHCACEAPLRLSAHPRSVATRRRAREPQEDLSTLSRSRAERA